MIGSRFRLLVLFISILPFAQAFAETDANPTPQHDSNPGNQQQGMQDNLEGSIPDSDLEDEELLENPRIVVPENLQEMPDVKAVSGKGETGKGETDKGKTGEDQPVDETEDPSPLKTEEKLDQFENEMQMERANRGSVLLEGTDKLMDLSRRPLTYI